MPWAGARCVGTGERAQVVAWHGAHGVAPDDLESLIDVDCTLCARLKIGQTPCGLTPCQCPPLRHLAWPHVGWGGGGGSAGLPLPKGHRKRPVLPSRSSRCVCVNQKDGDEEAVEGGTGQGDEERVEGGAGWMGQRDRTSARTCVGGRKTRAGACRGVWEQLWRWWCKGLQRADSPLGGPRRRSCCPGRQTESSPARWAPPAPGTPPSTSRGSRSSWGPSCRIRERTRPPRGKKRRPGSGTAPARPCPRSGSSMSAA
eukprot:scaffold17730_cov103-Isochrysis_galbana.AAC.2